ncbi:zinc finger protein 511-like isoform X2 [Acanthaster planci]|uniref:Zinc finger protein 511-like isoform X2 n=1 Tax=Acanthaster planci TaxID=133434 RepID=A0A8B7YII0_ACAPL|nr:zinc finger protein 511-like isoform X2 [Acanthaster planci]
MTAMESDRLVQSEPMQSGRRSWSYVPRRRRILPEDTFFQDGNLELSLAHKQMPIEDTEQDDYLTRHEDFKCHVIGCGQSFTTVLSYEVHYNGAHRNICHDCRRSYPSNHLLDIHVLESHDSLFEVMATKQPMYQCLVESCREKFADAQHRREHLIKDHHYPADFRFQKGIAKPRSPGKPRQTGEEAMETEAPVDGDTHCDTVPATHSDRPKTTCVEHQAPVENRQRRVPVNISFGRGGTRSFQRTGHHKHQSKSKKHSGHTYKQKCHTPKEEPMEEQLGEAGGKSERDFMNTEREGTEQEPMNINDEYS